MKDSLVKFECYPDKAQYLEGETVNILFEGLQNLAVDELLVAVMELEKEVLILKISQEELSEKKIYDRMEIHLPVGNYGVDVSIRSGEDIIRSHTAFDMVQSCTDSIRYGFLTDFTDTDLEDYTDIKYAVKLHLNALQFYDWMYRHDKLVSDTEKYQEPMGREINLQTIRNKIEACKKRGIRPFAYTAVYASSKEAFEEHTEWAFYKKNKEPQTYSDWLVFMDTSKDTSWCRHLIGEYEHTLSSLGFQGIQMDTYGYPKYAWNHEGMKISLAQTFPEMINKAKQAVQAIDEKAGVIFNAVNNWPVDYVAKANQDAVYIEVWPPHVTYHHIYSLVREAIYLGEKPVILAAYIEAFQASKTKEDILAAETSFLLTNAVVQASGATQIIHGETNGLLRNSYFVDYEVLREEFLPIVKAYCDFTVRYGKILFDRNAMDISMTAAGGINEDIIFSLGDEKKLAFSSCGEGDRIWTIIRESRNRIIIQLINLLQSSEIWNQPKYRKPPEITDIVIDVLLDDDITGVYYATPDDGEGIPVNLEYEIVQRENGQHIIFRVPKLVIWDLIWIEI